MTDQQEKHQHHISRRSAFLRILTERLELIIEGLQIVVAIIVIIGFCISIVSLLFDMKSLIGVHASEAFSIFLEHAFNLIIGIEFVRMLIKHTPGAALEVLLFAIARHMVIDGSSGLDLILGVASIAGIFAIRKYLYVHSFDSHMDHSSFEWFTSGKKQEDDTGP